MENYRELANLTECEYSIELMQRNSHYIRLIHAVLGLGGEISELRAACELNDKNNVIEEIGDFFWYLAIIENILERNLSDINDPYIVEGDTDTVINDLEAFVCEMIDSLKRQIFYGSPGKDWEYLGNQVVILLRTLCIRYGSTEKEVKTKNINKLKARYGEKFSEYAAINRDLAKEKEAINS